MVNSTMGKGGCILLSPPKFFTFGGVTNVWHVGLLVVVVMIGGCYGVAQQFVAIGFSDLFFDVTTTLFRWHGFVA